MKAKEVRALLPGLYRITWKNGGESVAAVGVCANGDRWIAPTNWIEPSVSPRAWRMVQEAKPLQSPTQPGTGASDDETWTCRDGRKITVGSMAEDHVRSVLRMILRKHRRLQAFADFRATVRKAAEEQWHLDRD